MMVCLFFFFKQKTAYDMRISDWSSDVCSSELAGRMGIGAHQPDHALQAVVALIARAGRHASKRAEGHCHRERRHGGVDRNDRGLRYMLANDIGVSGPLLWSQHLAADLLAVESAGAGKAGKRSEEHTSEL